MKKTLSLMLALAMVFALVLVVAPAAEAATPCDHTNHEGWTEWNETKSPIVMLSDSTGLKSGKYYLTSDVSIDRFRVEADNDVTICLNGFTLTSNPSSKATSSLDPIKGANGTTKVTFCDCSANKTGVFQRTDMGTTGRNGAMFYCRGNLEINLHAITVRLTMENKGADANKAALFYLNTGDNSVVNIYEGTKFEDVTTGVPTIYAANGQVNVHGVASAMSVFCADKGKLSVDGVDKTKLGEKVDIAAFTPAPAPAPGGSTNPGTGDSANLVVMGLGLVLGVAGMACLLPKKQTV